MNGKKFTLGEGLYDRDANRPALRQPWDGAAEYFEGDENFTSAAFLLESQAMPCFNFHALRG